MWQREVPAATAPADLHAVAARQHGVSRTVVVAGPGVSGTSRTVAKASNWSP